MGTSVNSQLSNNFINVFAALAVMAFPQAGTLTFVIIVAAVAAAVVIALLYRFGYLSGRRTRKGQDARFNQAIPQYGLEQRNQPRPRQASPQPQEVSAGQGSRALLIESRPVEIRPLQSPEKPIDIERIEKLIRGIENELVQVLKQTSADTTDAIISRINELKDYINQLERQCLMQSPPFVQMGYIPSSLSEFKELFRASFAGLMRGNDMIEYTGELGVNEELVRSMANYGADFMVMYSGGKYVYLVKYGDYSLVLLTEEYLDSVSSGLVRLLFRRFIDEVLKPQA